MKLEFHVKSGPVFDINTIRPRDIKLEDVAHGLSMLCRYNGSTIMFYSVAEHSVRASYLVSKRSEQKRVLMHDVAEALGIGDMIHPIKIHMPFFNELEAKLNEVVAKKYRFKPNFTEESYVKLADRAIGLAEARDLLLGGREWWNPWRTPEAVKLMNTIPKIYPWIPREAKERFLARAHQLGLS